MCHLDGRNHSSEELSGNSCSYTLSYSNSSNSNQGRNESYNISDFNRGY
jgi:hypothetical protein